MAYTRRPCANSSVMPFSSRGSTQWLKIHSRSFPDTPAPPPAKAVRRRPLSSVSSCQPIKASPPSSEAARTSLVAASQAYCFRSSLKNADFRFISVICSTPGFVLLMVFSIWIPLPFFRSLCQDGPLPAWENRPGRLVYAVFKVHAGAHEKPVPAAEEDRVPPWEICPDQPPEHRLKKAPVQWLQESSICPAPVSRIKRGFRIELIVECFALLFILRQIRYNVVYPMPQTTDPLSNSSGKGRYP